MRPVCEPFIVTKEYRRFAEFCDACRRYRYIGICYGAPGVGKTLSARHYASWDELKPVLQGQRTSLAPASAALAAECHSLLYTPTMTTTPKQLAEDLQGLRWDLTLAADRAEDPEDDGLPAAEPDAGVGCGGHQRHTRSPWTGSAGEEPGTRR